MVLGQSSVCFIIPWYGEYPWWMGYFLKSVESNPDYNWLLISDKLPENKLPSNIIFVEYSLGTLEALIFQKTGLKPTIKNPYKLCDFKPAYGAIFSDLIKEFNYWGYCDIDLVFGNISDFINPFLIDGFDVFSPDEEFFPGHFCLFRNSNKVNSLYNLANTVKEVFTSEKVFLFDEFLFSKGITCNQSSIKRAVKNKLERHKFLLRTKRLNILKPFGKIYRTFYSILKTKSLIDFNSVLKTQVKNKHLEVVRETMYLSDNHFFCDNKNNWEVKWCDGKLKHEDELLYFHFQISKSENDFKIIDKENGFTLLKE